MNRLMNKWTLVLICLLASTTSGWSQEWGQKFEQLGEMLPTPNSYRTGSGAPGPNYWQQKADYDIDMELDDKTQRITGKETITYTNHSPDVLTYLWLQLDQNIRDEESSTFKTQGGTLRDSLPAKSVGTAMGALNKDYGFKIKSVKDAASKDLPYVVNQTMMRVDLPKPMKSGEKFAFSIEWSFNIVDRMVYSDRGGLEYFPEDDNYVYTIAQWFPRMCVYDDYEGWQNKQFLGSGEFALPFGDYKVRITVPSDHIVASTGFLQNPKDVLTKAEQDRYALAQRTFDKPVIIVTEGEARQKEKTKSAKKTTWVYHAENVRDFAFASSRKFIWDAQAVKIGDKAPLAMSYYPKEGNPLWEKESTKAVVHTLEVYSKYTIDYPYPVAISVHAASIGMEYPMICFNFGRPNKDGSFSDRTKYGMIGVIIHEVGHNFFPMIINSDERQWTWMDEGLNSFLQYRVEQERYENFPSRRGPAPNIVPYMKGDKNLQRPIMTNSEQVLQLGNNAYGKPATALNILRETVMGPELFDKAFKEYAQRWAFKHPKPADFFRTMEDASAVDLDWFWRGWFYTTDHVDVSIENVKWFRLKSQEVDPEGKGKKTKKGDLTPASASSDKKDFSQGPTEISLVDTNPMFYGEFQSRVDDKAIRERLKDKNFYEIELKNVGGLVTPLIFEFVFNDGTRHTERIPAEIWRYNEHVVKKVFTFDKEVEKVILDPRLETADVNLEDNVFPRIEKGGKFEQMRKN
jgi:hypothetical protein